MFKTYIKPIYSDTIWRRKILFLEPKFLKLNFLQNSVKRPSLLISTMNEIKFIQALDQGHFLKQFQFIFLWEKTISILSLFY
jgi:hypothetical protein